MKFWPKIQLSGQNISKTRLFRDMQFFGDARQYLGLQFYVICRKKNEVIFRIKAVKCHFYFKCYISLKVWYLFGRNSTKDALNGPKFGMHIVQSMLNRSKKFPLRQKWTENVEKRLWSEVGKNAGNRRIWDELSQKHEFSQICNFFQ